MQATPTRDPEFDALDLCHRNTLIALGRLSALVRRLETVGTDQESRTLAGEIVQHFTNEARHHHAEEERLIFPPLLARGDEQMIRHIRRLQEDHSWIEEGWMALQPHLEALAAAQSWWELEALKAAVDTFTALSLDHIALEESILYPQARQQRAEQRSRAAERAQ